MTTGTKSVLFGVHAFWFHPITVALGWRRLYRKWPKGWEWVAILVHDIGYVGCSQLDDKKGKQHPIKGARIIEWLACKFKVSTPRVLELWDLVMFHSRDMAERHNVEPSKLCWADKYSIRFDPAWFYLLRARLSGEIKEYRANAKDKIPPNWTDRQWYNWLRHKFTMAALTAYRPDFL